MSDPGARRANRAASAGVLALLVTTLALTLARSLRWPNDFAEAHWLLDYRFGFVKRGLGGQLLSLATSMAGGPGETAIAVVSGCLLLGLGGVVVWTGWWIARQAAWSPAAVLAGVALASSPYVVMTGHLTGYFDGVIVLLAFGAILLMTSGRVWPAVALQSLAILMHESAVLVGFPVLCLAWWLSVRPGRPLVARWPAALPLALPAATFIVVALAGQFTPDIEDAFSARLAAHGFIEGDMHLLVPEWLRPDFAASWEMHQHRFAGRIAFAEMYGLMLPTILALLAYGVEAYRLPRRSVAFVALPVVVLAPEALHLAAWDTVRIWTYAIATSMLALVAIARTAGRPEPVSSSVRILAVVALVVNVMAMTPMLDNLADRYVLTTRLVMYAPVLAVAIWLFFRSDPPRS